MASQLSKYAKQSIKTLVKYPNIENNIGRTSRMLPKDIQSHIIMFLRIEVSLKG